MQLTKKDLEKQRKQLEKKIEIIDKKIIEISKPLTIGYNYSNKNKPCN